METGKIKDLLERKAEEYNQKGFIENDPIQIPHSLTLPQDREIMGFWAAMLAWGQRITIINKCNELVRLMDGAPYEFILHHRESDLKRFLNFRHRTFNPTDTLYFIAFFREYYQKSDSLEDTFSRHLTPGDITVEKGLSGFQTEFFSLPDFPARTLKHVATPARKSACKRLNMFLRWMVRQDDRGVDFGMWRNIGMHQLVCPLDLHVERVARKLGLLTRKQSDWQAALELTENLRRFNPNDPVRYDFALFGLGLEGF